MPSFIIGEKAAADHDAYGFVCFLQESNPVDATPLVFAIGDAQDAITYHDRTEAIFVQHMLTQHCRAKHYEPATFIIYEV